MILPRLVGSVIIGICGVSGTLLGASRQSSVTVCEVLANPLKFDGRMILLRGEIIGTDEGAWMTESGCPTPFITGEYVWPSSVYLQGNLSSKQILHAVKFRYDYTAHQRATTKVDYLRRQYPGRELRWIYEGLFETRRDWEPFLIRYPNGTFRYLGFGHLNEAPAQLITKAIHDVSLRP